MPDEKETSPAAEDSDPAVSDLSESRSSDENIQSLTDFFDQMDRAAFKRALENREAERRKQPKSSKLQRP